MCSIFIPFNFVLWLKSTRLCQAHFVSFGLSSTYSLQCISLKHCKINTQLNYALFLSIVYLVIVILIPFRGISNRTILIKVFCGHDRPDVSLLLPQPKKCIPHAGTTGQALPLCGHERPDLAPIRFQTCFSYGCRGSITLFFWRSSGSTVALAQHQTILAHDFLIEQILVFKNGKPTARYGVATNNISVRLIFSVII